MTHPTNDHREQARRISEIQERAKSKYRNVRVGAPLDEPCPGCGCVTFAAARSDVDTLLAIISTPYSGFISATTAREVATEYLQWHWYGGKEPFVNEVNVLGEMIASVLSSRDTEQYRDGLRDAAKVVCDCCANEEKYGPAIPTKGSMRLWHGDYPCNATAIHALYATLAPLQSENPGDTVRE